LRNGHDYNVATKVATKIKKKDEND